MKDVMRARFVPTYYNRDLFKKLQLLKQGTKSVEEYYKEMEIAMIRANVTEDDEQTMARFLNGLNHPIKKIADFQPYSNLIELVHQATKAERQVQDDFKYAKYSSKTYGFSNNQASTTPPTSTSTKPSPSNDDKPSYKKLLQVQVVFLLLQATSSRVLHHLLQPMRPSRQAPSSVSLAAAEATSPTNAQTSAP